MSLLLALTELSAEIAVAVAVSVSCAGALALPADGASSAATHTLASAVVPASGAATGTACTNATASCAVCASGVASSLSSVACSALSCVGLSCVGTGYATLSCRAIGAGPALVYPLVALCSDSSSDARLLDYSPSVTFASQNTNAETSTLTTRFR